MTHSNGGSQSPDGWWSCLCWSAFYLHLPPSTGEGLEPPVGPGRAVSWAPLCQLTPLFPCDWGLCAWHLWPQCLWGFPVCLTYTVPSPSEGHVDLMTERVMGTCHHSHPLLSTWRLCCAWGRAWQRKGSTAWSLPFPLVK